MEQFKRAQVVKTTTDNKENALKGYNDNSLIFKHTANYKTIEAEEGFTKFFHLYVVVEEEIKDGWFYNPHSGHIHKIGIHSDLKYINRNKCLKVIASTDTTLVSNPTHYADGTKRAFHTTEYIPQPSQQFIEKYIESYNKSEFITDVLVEYEKVVEMRQGYPKPSTINSKTEWNYDKIISYNLKVNPKDNTITIKKLKDSWNLEEMCSNMQYYMEHCKRAGYITPHQWLKENL
jgi:hypothetical protein